MKAYLDSCIVIYLVEAGEEYRAAVQNVLETCRPEETSVSDLVRLECRVGPIRRGDAAILERFDQFFSDAAEVTLTSAVYDLAAELRAHHRLKTPDAIHAAAAITHGCDEFWTNDSRLAAIEGRIRIRVVP